MKSIIKKVLGVLFQISQSKKHKYFYIGFLLAWLCLCALLVLSGIWWVAVLLTIILGLGLALFFFACHVNKKWLAKERPTSYFQDLTQRNMDAIVVGSTKAWKYLQIEPIKSRVYNCLTYCRSTAMDFATLKTYFSHVRSNGKAFLFVDWSESRRLGFRIYPRDWNYIHPHIFLELGIKQDKHKCEYPMYYYPRFSAGYFISAVAKKLGLYKRTTWKKENGMNININTKPVKDFVDRLSKMVQFCYDRDIEPVLLLMSGNKDTNCANEIIRAYFAPRAYDISVEIIQNAQQLNQYVYEHIVNGNDH